MWVIGYIIRYVCFTLQLPVLRGTVLASLPLTQEVVSSNSIFSNFFWFFFGVSSVEFLKNFISKTLFQ